MTQLPRQHHKLSTMMCFMRDKVTQKMHKISWKILPVSWRNVSTPGPSEFDQLDHPTATTFERAARFLPAEQYGDPRA
jgi:hypothetical protein